MYEGGFFIFLGMRGPSITLSGDYEGPMLNGRVVVWDTLEPEGAV